MSEVDLIPEEFRQFKLLKQRVKYFIVLYVIIIVVIGFAKLWLVNTVNSENDLLTTLKTEENSILGNRQVIDGLQAKRDELDTYLAVLESLRGGPKAEHMFVALDRAINDSVWITRWKFMRAGEKTGSNSANHSVGYFVVPKAQVKPVDQWSNQVRMEIAGQALTHSALADFVTKLVSQSEVADVRLQSTSIKPFLSGQAIAYDLSVKIHKAEVN